MKQWLQQFEVIFLMGCSKILVITVFTYRDYPGANLILFLIPSIESKFKS